jgi:hypothetical protein
MAGDNGMRSQIAAASSIMAAAAAIMFAAPAAATPSQDREYLALLVNPPAGQGFEPVTKLPIDTVIIEAHAVCSVLAEGRSLPVVVMAVDVHLDLSMGQSAWLVGSAVAVYCPQYVPADVSEYR